MILSEPAQLWRQIERLVWPDRFERLKVAQRGLRLLYQRRRRSALRRREAIAEPADRRDHVGQPRASRQPVTTVTGRRILVVLHEPGYFRMYGSTMDVLEFVQRADPDLVFVSPLVTITPRGAGRLRSSSPSCPTS